MTDTPDIIDAEVVEVPKLERPELWIQIAREPTLADPGAYAAYFACVEKPRTVPCDHFLVRIPGTQPAPNNAPATDAGLRRAAGYLETAEKHIRSEQWNVVAVAVASASAELAKIRGGK